MDGVVTNGRLDRQLTWQGQAKLPSRQVALGQDQAARWQFVIGWHDDGAKRQQARGASRKWLHTLTAKLTAAYCAVSHLLWVAASRSRSIGTAYGENSAAAGRSCLKRSIAASARHSTA